MTPHVNPMKTFDHSFGRTEDLTTFMQQNIFTIDLGYVTNVGYTERFREIIVIKNNNILISGNFFIYLRMTYLLLKYKSD